jgi:uncharacterized membrane protein YjgN (DUF898 family)
VLFRSGIFYPWYLKNVIKHVTSNIEYKNIRFDFGGKGLDLFFILLLTVLVPMIIWGVFFVHMVKAFQADLLLRVLSYVILYLLLVPYIYHIYKWMVHISYKGFMVEWNTVAMPSILKIFREIVLTMVTAGIYFPVACAKLYDYFINKTVITKDGIVVHTLHVKLDYFAVWKTTWAQVLLTIVTCGIYGAWAYCKIAAIYVNNTSIETMANN